jgi:hypothetical protein
MNQTEFPCPHFYQSPEILLPAHKNSNRVNRVKLDFIRQARPGEKNKQPHFPMRMIHREMAE